jgi:hypothetical protein
MALQIQTAHDREDEIDLTRWLNVRASWLSVPRVVTRGFEVVPLGMGDSIDQIIFPAAAEPRIMAGIAPMVSKPGQQLVATPASRGLCLEWSRTKCLGSETYVVGGAEGSRLFYEIASEASALTDLVHRAAKGFFKQIRESSPMIDPRYLRYIGAHMAASVSAKDARLLYPNGSELRLAPNPKFKGNR